jgi:rubrerythrin
MFSGNSTMSFQEKRNIAIGMENMPSARLEEIITIIHSYEPMHATRNVDKTWDIDLARLSDNTLRIIDQVIRRPRPVEQFGSRKSSLSNSTSTVSTTSGSMSPRRSSRRASIGCNISSPRLFREHSMNSITRSTCSSNSDSQNYITSSSNNTSRHALTRNDSLELLLSAAESPACMTIMGVTEMWACPNCTYDNEFSRNKCEICGDNKPIMPSSSRMLPGQDAPFKITATVAAGETSDSEVDYSSLIGNSSNSTTTTNNIANKNNNKHPSKGTQNGSATSSSTTTKRKRGRPKKNATSKISANSIIKKKRRKKNSEPHTCKFCGKTFHYTTNWRSHERMHTGEKI